MKAALVDIVTLTGTVYYMTVPNKAKNTRLFTHLTWFQYTLHGPTKGKSTWLLAPYCIWLTFATYLNSGFVWLNLESQKQKHPKKED